MPFTGGKRPVGEHSTAGNALVHHRTTQTCHSEEQSDVGISGRQLRFRRWLSHDPAGYCEIATSAYGLLAMTNRGASTVLTAADTDWWMPSRDCHVGLWPPRNDKSGGQHCFNGGRYGSGVPSRDCHVASLLAMTNRGASTVLTAAGTDRGVPSRDCHGRGAPSQ